MVKFLQLSPCDVARKGYSGVVLLIFNANCELKETEKEKLI
jgi:hypothetical protein